MWRKGNNSPAADIFLNNFNGIVVFDTETTGLNPNTARIVELAAVKLDKDLLQIDEFHTLCNPGIHIPDDVTMIHGITDEMVAEAPRADDVVAEFVEFASGLPLAGYNGDRYDIPIVKCAMERKGVCFECKSVDVLQIAKKVYAGANLPNNKLSTVAQHVGFAGNFHSAMDDVLATAEILRKSIDIFLKPEPKPVISADGIKILSASFWGPGHKLARIYIQTSKGGIYYDIYKSAWNGKDVDIDGWPMEDVERMAWNFVGASSEKEFKAFRGKKTQTSQKTCAV